MSSFSNVLVCAFEQTGAQIGIAPLQLRQHSRQDVRRKCRDNAEAQASCQQPAAVTREVHKIASRAQNQGRALGNRNTASSQNSLALVSLNQLAAEEFLKLVDLH